MASLKDKIQKEEKLQEEKEITTKKSPVKKMVSSPVEMKSKKISAAIKPSIFDKFQKICAVQGLSVNSALNMLMANYVKEHAEELAASEDEENI